MKVTELIEMTQRVNSYENLKLALPEFQKLLKDGNHCGDIEQYNIYKKTRNQYTDYGFFENNSCIGFTVLEGNEIINVYVIPEKRKTGIFPMFLFFLKKKEGIGSILLGDQHSEELIDALSKIYMRFKTSWIKDNEKVPYDPSTVDQFYSPSNPTGWKVLLENSFDFSKETNTFEGLGLLDSRSLYRQYLIENETPKITYRENGDKSWNVRIETKSGGIAVHTRKKRSDLEKFVKQRYKF